MDSSGVNAWLASGSVEGGIIIWDLNQMNS